MSQPATLAPALVTEVPGPRSRALAERLRAVESRNVTCLAPEPPIFWERAAGANVWDVGRQPLRRSRRRASASRTSGHAHPRVVRAVAEQAERLLHGMGDVHPSAVKVELLEALAARFPGGGPARGVLGSSGSDAVEAALKTALLATGRAGVVAFEGAYHGLSLGALDATWRADFRAPFAARLPGAHRLRALRRRRRRAPRRARGARFRSARCSSSRCRAAAASACRRAGFLRGAARGSATREGWLLIADEVYTGFGRTGRWFACEHEGVVPDLLCVGKGLASGMPISACVGRARGDGRLARVSRGEALHTQTFLGHPPALRRRARRRSRCSRRRSWWSAPPRRARAALAQLRAAHARARPAVAEVRGLGLLLGDRVRRARDRARAPAAGAAPRRDRAALPATTAACSRSRRRSRSSRDALARRRSTSCSRGARVSRPDPARAELDARVLAWMREPWRATTTRASSALALELFAFQFEHCAPYRRFCEGRGAHAGARVRALAARSPPSRPAPSRSSRCASFPAERTLQGLPHQRHLAARRAARCTSTRSSSTRRRCSRASSASCCRTSRRASASRIPVLAPSPGEAPRLLALAHVRRRARAARARRAAASSCAAARLARGRARSRALDGAPPRSGEPLRALRHRLRVRAPARRARGRGRAHRAAARRARHGDRRLQGPRARARARASSTRRSRSASASRRAAS